jgi:hypothetical protein
MAETKEKGNIPEKKSIRCMQYSSIANNAPSQRPDI